MPFLTNFCLTLFFSCFLSGRTDWPKAFLIRHRALRHRVRVLSLLCSSCFLTSVKGTPPALENGGKNGSTLNLKPILIQSTRSAFGPIIYNVLLSSGHPTPSQKPTTKSMF